MKKLEIFLFAMLFVFGVVSMPQAAPKYYTFQGTLTHISITPGGSTTLITDQGINIGDELTFVIMIDFDRPGEITRNNGETYNAGTFYADLILSDPAFEGVNRDYNTDPHRVAEYNYGWVTEYDTGWRSDVYVGPGDAYPHLTHSGIFPIPIYDWEEGQVCEVHFRVDDHLNEIGACGYTTGTLTSISDINPIYRDAIIADEPFCYYRLGESMVTSIVLDEMGNHDGSFQNDPTVGVPGALLTDPINTAVCFEPDQSQYVELTTLGDYGSMMTEGFSVEYWLKTNDPSIGQSILGSIHIPEFVSNFFVGTDWREGSVRLYFRDHNWNRYNVYSHSEDRTVDIFNDQWHHIVHVYDPTGPLLEDRMLYYVDGVKQTLEIQTGGGVPSDFRNFNVPMVLAAQNKRGNITEFLNGCLDEVAFYTRSLTADQVNSHYQASGRAPQHRPIADAGDDQAVFDKVTLNGSGSYDADGTIVSYEWKVCHRKDSAYDRHAQVANPTISDLEPGFYDVTLMVTDDDGLTGTATMLLAAAGLCAGWPQPNADFDVWSFKIKKLKRFNWTTTSMRGTIDIPELNLGNGDTVESRVTIELFGVLSDGSDLVMSDEASLSVKDYKRFLVIKK